VNSFAIKGELGELEFYFRKIPLHQQKFLVVSLLSIFSWQHFSPNNYARSNFLYLFRDGMN